MQKHGVLLSANTKFLLVFIPILLVSDVYTDKRLELGGNKTLSLSTVVSVFFSNPGYHNPSSCEL